jgi:hypothetical protein
MSHASCAFHDFYEDNSMQCTDFMNKINHMFKVSDVVALLVTVASMVTRELIDSCFLCNDVNYFF